MNIEPDVAIRYLGFVQERHLIWVRRQEEHPQAFWTEDPILATRKFTNVFRILDPGTQFLVQGVLAPHWLTEEEALMLIFLYRHTGQIPAWNRLFSRLGWPRVENLGEVEDLWRKYRGEGNPIFTGAYLVYPQSSEPGTDKMSSIIGLARRLFSPDSPEYIFPDWESAETMEGKFNVLRRNRGVADFMSQQILTDWSYTKFCGRDRENEFVRPGPGAVKGAKFIAPEEPVQETLNWARSAVLQTPDCPYLDLSNGRWTRYRPPSLMDIQNTLCEFSKYERYYRSGTPAGKAVYSASHPGPQDPPLLPEHWKGTEE